VWSAALRKILVDRTQRAGGGLGHIRMERGGDFVSMLTPVEPETFKWVAFKICQEAGVQLLLHTVVDEVRAVGGHVEVSWSGTKRVAV
jgi:hypothetical protein